MNMNISELPEADRRSIAAGLRRASHDILAARTAFLKETGTTEGTYRELADIKREVEVLMAQLLGL